MNDKKNSRQPHFSRPEAETSESEDIEARGAQCAHMLVWKKDCSYLAPIHSLENNLIHKQSTV